MPDQFLFDLDHLTPANSETVSMTETPETDNLDDPLFGEDSLFNPSLRSNDQVVARPEPKVPVSIEKKASANSPSADSGRVEQTEAFNDNLLFSLDTEYVSSDSDSTCEFTDEGLVAPTVESEEAENFTTHDLNQAVLRWLYQAEPPPQGVAVKVPTRLQNHRASIAAFWCTPRRNYMDEGIYRLFEPTATAIIETRLSAAETWPDLGDASNRVTLLEAANQRRRELEETIKLTEPHLRPSGHLFDEYIDWDFGKSQNPHYHKTLGEINALQKSIYEGTHFEKISRAMLADRLFLAVPAHTVNADQLPDEWGLLWVYPDLTVDMIKEPEPLECHPQFRMHLVQNIASAASRSVLFAQGVKVNKDGDIDLLARPRRRRKSR